MPGNVVAGIARWYADCMGYEQATIDADAEGPIRHKLTVEEFLILDEAGVFGDDRVELIDGEIFVLSPIYQPHGRVLADITIEMGLALRRLDAGLRCYTPVSTLIDKFNLPEPDLLVAEDDGGDGFMSRDAIRIAVEVSGSTIRYDLVKKAELYARFGLPEYWVVDVNGRRIIRMHRPDAGRYIHRAEFAFGGPIPSATIPGLIIDTASL